MFAVGVSKTRGCWKSEECGRRVNVDADCWMMRLDFREEAELLYIDISNQRVEELFEFHGDKKQAMNVILQNHDPMCHRRRIGIDSLLFTHVLRSHRGSAGPLAAQPASLHDECQPLLPGEFWDTQLDPANGCQLH